jgi:hypothetical protein
MSESKVLVKMLCLNVSGAYSFVIKILIFTNGDPNIEKLIGEYKIFIALVRSLGIHAGFLQY